MVGVSSDGEPASTMTSVVKGPTDQPLYTKSLGELVHEQAQKLGDKTAVVVTWQKYRASFKDLEISSANVGKAIIDLNLSRQSHVGVFAGNRQEYLNVFLGGARIGRPVVVLNTLYTPTELCNAVVRSGTIPSLFQSIVSC